jgi:PAS domain S-box-containing protein
VPASYISGDALWDTSTYLNQIFASLDAAPGTYCERGAPGRTPTASPLTSLQLRYPSRRGFCCSGSASSGWRRHASGGSGAGADRVSDSGASGRPNFFPGSASAWIAAPIPIRALADKPSPAGNAQRQTAQDRCEFLLDNVSAIVLSLDSDGKITFLNHYGEDFFEYSAKEILGKPVLGTLTPATGFEGRDLASFLDGLRRDPDRYAFSVNQNILRNGEKVWTFWANKGIYDDRGQVKEVLRVGLDISERERRLEAATEELREITTMLQGRSWVQRKKLKEIAARIEAISEELERPWTLSKSGIFESVAPPTH